MAAVSEREPVKESAINAEASSYPDDDKVGFPGVPAVVGNALRGGLIGSAELVPGVSGGTVALVTGVYDRLLYNGSVLIGGIKGGITGPDRGAQLRRARRKIDWWLLLPMALLMFLAVFLLAGVLHDFVENSPEVSRSLFGGMVAASIAVPLMMARESARGEGGFKPVRAALTLVLGFVIGLILVSIPGEENPDPSYLVVFFAAAIAVCALAMPGVSGSYLLLAMGLYAPTLAAVDERNLAYIGVFMLGALFGIAAFIKLLEYLLNSHRTITLLAMTGLMAGSLRALWPWQDDDGALRGIEGNWPVMLGFFVIGVGVVVAVLIAERFLGQGKIADPPSTFGETETAKD